MSIKVEVFTSDSCPHCPGAIAVAEQAKEQLGDKIDVEVLNINNVENREKAISLQIMAVPTIVIDGKVEFVGAPTSDQLISKLESM